MGDDLSYGLNTLGPLCLWQCFKLIPKMKMVKSTPPSKKRRLLIKLVKGPRQGLTFFSTSKLDIWFVLIFMNLTLLATMKE